MDFCSIYIAFSIFLTIINCAPTENSTSTIETSTSISTKTTPCTQPLCPQILCAKGYKRIDTPCSCSKCVPDVNSNITTISLSTKSEEHSITTGNHNLSTTIGFPRHVCRFACKVESCKDGEELVRHPSLLCSCPRCEPVQSTAEGLTSTDPSALDKSSLPSTHCIQNCPLIICKTGEKLQQTPGECQCPKCVPGENSTLKTQSVRTLATDCKFLCKIPSCPPGEILYRDPSDICSCPKCVPDFSFGISRPPRECDIVCLVLACPPGQILFRDPSIVCGCPKCILDIECVLTCPLPICPIGQISYRDPAHCSCPKCVPDPSLYSSHRPIQCKFVCPLIDCPFGETLYKNPSDICACPKCIPDPHTPYPIRTPRLTYECKVTCPDYVCAPGQRLEKDPADGCSCPRCVTDTPYIPEPHCDLLFCPQLRCLEGEVVVREARECSCPRCECIRPPVCPVGACAGIWKYPACGCPICLVSYDVEAY